MDKLEIDRWLLFNDRKIIDQTGCSSTTTPFIFECSTGKLIANSKYITAETSLSTATVHSGLSRLQELPIISVYDIFALTLNPDKQDKGENKLIF